MTTYLLFGSAGTRERAAALAAEHRGVFWSPELGRMIIVDPIGMIKLMQGGGARESDGETLVWPRDGGAVIALRPLCAVDGREPDPS